MRNIVLIVVDCLRPDHLGCYGYELPTTPRLDEFAKQGMKYSSCYSHSNCTYPSLATIYTGLEPREHGIRHHSIVDKYREHQLYKEKNFETIQSLLKSKGYTTLAFDWLGEPLRAGFDFYSGILENYHAMDNCNKVFEAIISKMTTDVTSPFFLFVHFWDCHVPYVRGKSIPELLKRSPLGIPKVAFVSCRGNAQVEKYRWDCFAEYQDASDVIAAYDTSINHVDRVIGSLVAFLKVHFNNLAFIVTADHGESLIEHETYFTHYGLFRQVLHVPFLAWGDGVGIGVDEGFVSLADLKSYIVDGRLPSVRRSSILSVDGVGEGGYSIIDEDFHYILEKQKGEWKEYLFDFRNDIDEKSEVQDNDWLASNYYFNILKERKLI